MEKCRNKDRLYNPVTKRCYKSCEQKNKDEHPVTRKCRIKCKNEKIRRLEDFRCVKKTLKAKNKNTITKKKIPTPPPREKTPPPKEKTPSPKAIEEELIPPPLQAELQKNFTFLDDFLNKGYGKTVSYSGASVSEFITIYFHEKYKQNCPMYPIKTYSKFETDEYKKFYKKNKNKYTDEEFKKYLLQKYKYYYIDWNKDKFLKNLKLCLDAGEKIIMVPLRPPEHLNMLIIKTSTREIIRFEPHGSKFSSEYEDKKVNIFLNKLTADINSYLNLADNKRFTYISPSDLCPNYTKNAAYFKMPGFQAMEAIRKKGKGEGGGFCQLWSWFFAECVIQNPEMDVKEVYKDAFDYLNHNQNNFATIIRGYFYSINDELKNMKKNFTIKKDKNTTGDNADALLEYLNQSNERLQKKPKKTFQDGGVKKPKFILPTANPKAEPVHI